MKNWLFSFFALLNFSLFPMDFVMETKDDCFQEFYENSTEQIIKELNQPPIFTHESLNNSTPCTQQIIAKPINSIHHDVIEQINQPNADINTLLIANACFAHQLSTQSANPTIINNDKYSLSNSMTKSCNKKELKRSTPTPIDEDEFSPSSTESSDEDESKKERKHRNSQTNNTVFNINETRLQNDYCIQCPFNVISKNHDQEKCGYQYKAISGVHCPRNILDALRKHCKTNHITKEIPKQSLQEYVFNLILGNTDQEKSLLEIKCDTAKKQKKIVIKCFEKCSHYYVPRTNVLESMTKTLQFHYKKKHPKINSTGYVKNTLKEYLEKNNIPFEYEQNNLKE